jgi:anti-sigma B factor antagonist
VTAIVPNLPPDVNPGGLEIGVSEHGTTTTIALQGEWDIASAPATRDAIRKALDRYPECVVLDLSSLGFIDSGGLHVAVELQRRAARQNARLVILPGSRAVQRLFEICQLSEVLPFRIASETPAEATDCPLT